MSEKRDPNRLIPVELDHLLSLLRDAKKEGSYYGNKAQYWTRHERIAAKLQEQFDLWTSEKTR